MKEKQHENSSVCGRRAPGRNRRRGFYRGWFSFSTNSTDQKPSATITVDKDKIHADEEMAKEKVEGLGHKAKEKTGDMTEKVKQ